MHEVRTHLEKIKKAARCWNTERQYNQLPNDQKKGVATLYRLSKVFATIFLERTVFFMPRKSNSTRSDGRISVQVYLGTVDGRKKYKSVYGKTQKEADQKADEIRRALQKGLDIMSTCNFADVAQKWLDSKRNSISRSQVVQYQSCLNHLNQYIGDKDIRKLSPNDLQEIIDRLARINPNTRQPSSHRTLVAIKSTALQVANYAISARLTDFNFALSVSLPKDNTVPHRRALNETERKTILQVEHRGKLPAMIMMYAGLRRGELLALTWDDIDLVRQTITINKSAEVINNQIRIKDGAKTKSSVRVVNIPSALSDYLTKQKKKAKSDIVCPAADGSYMSLTSWRRMWKSYIHALQQVNPHMPDFTGHWLRHTYATILYQAGVDVLTAKELLGHSKIQTTLDIYTHLDSQFKSKNIDKLNAFLDSI